MPRGEGLAKKEQGGGARHWLCPACGEINKAKRPACTSCGKERPEGAVLPPKAKARLDAAGPGAGPQAGSSSSADGAKEPAAEEAASGLDGGPGVRPEAGSSSSADGAREPA